VVYKKFEKIPLTVYLGRPLSSVLFDWKCYVTYLCLITSILLITTIYLFYRFYLENLKFKEQQIEVVNAARMSSIGLMAASIAHEINNPLTIILGRSRKALKLLNDPNFNFDKENLNMYFSKIHDASLRMTKIISGVKVIARDANQDQFDEVWANDLIEHVTDYLSERYKVHGVELIIEDIPQVLVRCRESQIAQVLVNLLNNAYDAIEDLNEKWIKIDFKIVDQKIQIMIMDSGLGISPEIRAKIMNPFFTSKVTSKGTGLGLYISSKILKEHQGELRYDDSYRHTTFVIELPLNQVKASDN
jgi:C4-dicarboxylate-specific signal transduction histidine kinase